MSTTTLRPGLAAAEPEHYHARGWKGGPGECGAECACGLTYDGFDTLGEPSALLDRHIAQETGTADPDDYWAQLAISLREVADKVATLAGNQGKPQSVNLYLSGGYSESQAHRTVPMVDAIAAALGTTAKTKTEGRGASRRSEHRAEVRVGAVRVVTYAYVPTPPTRAEKRANLAARNAELEAELAAARKALAARDTEPAPSIDPDPTRIDLMSPHRAGHCPTDGPWTSTDGTGCPGCARRMARHA